MPIPNGLNAITVTGYYPDLAGGPQSGTIAFSTSIPIANAAGATVFAGTVTRQVYNGVMQSALLPCTDSAGLNPANFTYQVTETFPSYTRTYSIALPHTLGATVDLSALVPVATPPAASAFASDNTWTGTQTFSGNPPLKIPAGASNGYVLTSDASGAATWAAGGSASVTSVNGRTGVVVLAAADVGADASGAAASAQTAAQTFATNAVATETTRAQTAEGLALQKSNNLSDVANAATARTNLGLTGAATASLPISIANGGTGQTAQQAAINALTGTQSTGTYLRSNGTNASLSAIQAADVPGINGVAVSGAAANGNVLTATSSSAATWQAGVSLDSTATDITVVGNQIAGAVGKAADSGHVHGTQLPLPTDFGLLAMVDNPTYATATATLIAGTVYLVKIPVHTALTATNVLLNVSTGGAGSSTGSFVGLYSSSGTLLTSSSDTGTALTGTGAVTLALTTPQSLTANSFVWIAILVNLATTQPILRAYTNTNAVVNFGNSSAATLRFGVNGTGKTSLASIVPSSNNTTGFLAPWAGIS